MPNLFFRKTIGISFFAIVFLSAGFQLKAQSNAAKGKNYFTIESYYKVKWGHAAEFIGLWKKNHYPLLKKALENGDIISISASEPKFHSGEDNFRMGFAGYSRVQDRQSGFSRRPAGCL